MIAPCSIAFILTYLHNIVYLRTAVSRHFAIIIFCRKKKENNTERLLHFFFSRTSSHIHIIRLKFSRHFSIFGVQFYSRGIISVWRGITFSGLGIYHVSQAYKLLKVSWNGFLCLLKISNAPNQIINASTTTKKCLEYISRWAFRECDRWRYTHML